MCYSRRALAIGRLTTFALAFAFVCGASAHESHADASSTTRAAACKLSVDLARQGIPADHVTASHCECLEIKDERTAPWSCTGFVSYR
jgi:hypothetical protein